MSERDLERRLRDLGGRLDHAEPQALAADVRRRIEREGGARRPHQRRGPRHAARRRRPAVWAAAAAALLVGGVAIAQLVIPGVDVQRVPVRPSAPAPGQPELLGLGRSTTLAEAREAVDINVLVPQRLGRPDDVFVGDEPDGGRVTLVYEPSPELPRDPATGAGMLITLFRGTTSVEFVQKQVGPGTSVRSIDVEGAPGMWIDGAPHQVLYLDADGRDFNDRLRLAGNVLIWQVGTLTLRLESRLDLDPSLEVAGSMA
jgi:hypothetical protein